LKHWFANTKVSELLRWHKEKHEQDAGMIRHPAKFAIDLKNIRIAMSIDGMNPFMNSSIHNTWLVVLTILSIHSWLCNKQKYIMMSELISGPQQLENDIDTYFRHMVEDLKELWYNDGVQV
jgi:hypothetical protein